jgi:hypothetical protein
MPEEAGMEQQLRFYDGIPGKTVEVLEVKESEPLLERRAKPSLGKPALHGHLAPLKSGLDPSSGTGLLAFLSFAGGLTVTRANSSPYPFPLLP